MSTTDDAPRAGRREWIGLAVIALPCLLYSMDLTVLHLAVPKLSADLKPTSARLLWIIDIYGFLVAGDEVGVDIELDTEPREITAPPDFADALDCETNARQNFDGLSYSRKLHCFCYPTASST